MRSPDQGLPQRRHAPFSDSHLGTASRAVGDTTGKTSDFALAHALVALNSVVMRVWYSQAYMPVGQCLTTALFFVFAIPQMVEYSALLHYLLEVAPSSKRKPGHSAIAPTEILAEPERRLLISTLFAEARGLREYFDQNAPAARLLRLQRTTEQQRERTAALSRPPVLADLGCGLLIGLIRHFAQLKELPSLAIFVQLLQPSGELHQYEHKRELIFTMLFGLIENGFAREAVQLLTITTPPPPASLSLVRVAKSTDHLDKVTAALKLQFIKLATNPTDSEDPSAEAHTAWAARDWIVTLKQHVEAATAIGIRSTLGVTFSAADWVSITQAVLQRGMKVLTQSLRVGSLSEEETTAVPIDVMYGAMLAYVHPDSLTPSEKTQPSQNTPADHQPSDEAQSSRHSSVFPGAHEAGLARIVQYVHDRYMTAQSSASSSSAAAAGLGHTETQDHEQHAAQRFDAAATASRPVLDSDPDQVFSSKRDWNSDGAFSDPNQFSMPNEPLTRNPARRKVRKTLSKNDDAGPTTAPTASAATAESAGTVQKPRREPRPEPLADGGDHSESESKARPSKPRSTRADDPHRRSKSSSGPAASTQRSDSTRSAQRPPRQGPSKQGSEPTWSSAPSSRPPRSDRSGEPSRSPRSPSAPVSYTHLTLPTNREV